MARPVIWTIDDDPEVLLAVERDVRHRYADRFRVMRADSEPPKGGTPTGRPDDKLFMRRSCRIHEE